MIVSKRNLDINWAKYPYMGSSAKDRQALEIAKKVEEAKKKRNASK